MEGRMDGGGEGRREGRAERGKDGEGGKDGDSISPDSDLDSVDVYEARDHCGQGSEAVPSYIDTR